jgi:hypothetical protein
MYIKLFDSFNENSDDVLNADFISDLFVEVADELNLREFRGTEGDLSAARIWDFIGETWVIYRSKGSYISRDPKSARIHGKDLFIIKIKTSIKRPIVEDNIEIFVKKASKFGLSAEYNVYTSNTNLDNWYIYITKY